MPTKTKPKPKPTNSAQRHIAAGRKPIQIWLEPDIFAALRDQADRDDRSMTLTAARLIRDYFSRIQKIA